MTIADSQNLSRTAQRLVVEFRRGFGNPPVYSSNWEPVWDVKVDRIEINHGARPNVATVWFPTLRWNESPGLVWGDMVRIRTDELASANRTILFVGYATNRTCEFSGGSERPGAGYERNAVVCLDQRWVLAMGLIYFGQWARGPDDYYPNPPPEGLPDSDTQLTAQRAIFNPDGKPNKDPQDEESTNWPDFPLFCNPAGPNAVFWTARDMIRFLLHSSWEAIDHYCPIYDPAQLTGLEVTANDAENWGKVLHHLVIEGLNVIEAVELVCKHIGWSFRLDYSNNGHTYFVFYKVGVRDQSDRASSPVISHTLHAPAVDKDIGDAVSEGRKMLWSMSLSQDIAPVVNVPVALGAPHRFEFTAELVPAWQDNYTTYFPNDLDNLYFTDAELQDVDDPDSLFYFSYYHGRGIVHNQHAYIHNVARKWALNESGLYTDPAVEGEVHYDRGDSFDWKKVIPPEYILDETGKRLFARYNRRLLPCLTVQQDGLSSVGIKLEFSFDGGQTWQVIPCSVRLLDGECGIFIDEPNIADIVDKENGVIQYGPLANFPLNLFTSIIDDKANTVDFKTGQALGHFRSWKAGEWRTRIRITASVQMDNRVMAIGKPSPSSGSPFDQSQIYDWSEKYGLSKRTSSSVFAAGFPGVREVDNQAEAYAHIDSIRKNNEDMSISGRFTLDRLWLGDGDGQPTFMVGDVVGYITGREYNLELLTFEGGKSSPEIIQIIYLPETQKQVLITRDLRYAEVRL